VLILTTRSPGFPYHAYPEDHWRFSREAMSKILATLDMWGTVQDDPEEYGVLVTARKPQPWNPMHDKLHLVEVHHMRRSETKQAESPNGLSTHEVNGQKVVVAFPLYQHVSTAFFFNWLQMDKSALVGTVAADGSMYLPQKMETLIAKAFEFCPDFDRFVVMEQDMIPPLDAFNRIAQYGYEHDIVGATYFKHEAPYHVMAWMQVDKPRFSPLTRDVVKTMVESPGLYQVDGVAMGFTSIARHVLEDWNPEVPMWVPTPPFVGHDLHFCHEAKKPQHGPNRDTAYKVWLDSGIGCGHLTLIPIGYPHSQEALAENEPDTWEEALSQGNFPSPETVM
jgi:hypothetical protein